MYCDKFLVVCPITGPVRDTQGIIRPLSEGAAHSTAQTLADANGHEYFVYPYLPAHLRRDPRFNVGDPVTPRPRQSSVSVTVLTEVQA